MELHFIYLALCWLSIQASYVTRMTPAPRMRTPVAFRPGVSIRPWMNQRIMAAASRRAPYILYRTPMHRFAKPYPSNNQHVRHVFNAGGPWKTTSRMPFPSASPEFDFKPSATSPSRSQSDGGAIHTIPAPNLSLSEKPIIVLDGKQNFVTSISATTEPTMRPNYEVTEKLVDPYRFGEKVIQAAPVGFSKPPFQGIPQADLSTLMRNNLALQLASEYGLSAVALPPAGPGLPQEIQIHNLQNIQFSNPQEIPRPGFDSIFIPPSALYQPDQAFLQKLQNQLFERFPSVEFVPYQTQSVQRPQSQVNFQLANPITTPVFTSSPVQTATSPIQNVATHQPHLSVLPVNNEQHKNVVRETQETVVTLLPQIAPENVTENQVEIITASQARNLTVPIPVLVDVSPAMPTSTVKYTETSTESTSPIYYAHIGQTVGNIVANEFFSALNDVRAAAALAQEDQNKITPEIQSENATTASSSTTTTMNPDLQNYFVKSIEKDENNQTVAEVKPLLGVPFAKSEPIRVEYSVIRTDDKSQKVNKDGTVYAGQIVQSSISEDHEYNKMKADLHSRRPPLRLHDKETKTTTPPSKLTVVKAKIPPKSKLTFDEKTGEPILRIYASYVDSPLHKDMIASKIANIKHVKEFTSRNQDVKSESYKGSPKSLKKLSSGSDNNQVTEFGLKLRSRVDDIVPIFDEYEE